MTNASKPRIAAYGFVDRDAGSVASANFLILEEFLRRGIEVDFYAIAGFIEPRELIGRSGFRYVPVEVPPVKRIWRFLENDFPARLRGVASSAFSQVSNLIYEQAIGDRVNRDHGDDPFDFFLTMGGLSPFATPGLLNIGWPQGPPNGEWDAIRSQRKRVIELAGRAHFAMLRAGYVHKRILNRLQLPANDLVLCGSEWSRGVWVEFGARPEAVVPLPYPYDLERFRPVRPPGRGRQTTYLALGRIVPRKRIDLLIEAFRQLHAKQPDTKLIIIGRFAYAAGFESLLGGLGPDSGIEYRPSIDRALVPDLLSEVDVVVQPSEMENLGSAVIEGLACGRPVIVGPTNGTRDYVSESSIVMDAYDVDALTRAMEMMRERVRSEPERVMTEARAAAERHVEPVRVVDRLLDLAERARSGVARGLPAR
ncbi:MAG: glycosyltransferase family 4 protein [Isosphaeraceae bacterium]|nr:glycosyltransferase family 4 protein [Isosphaeraceae bacterium]